MSSRVLRKLQGADDIVDLNNAAAAATNKKAAGSNDDDVEEEQDEDALHLSRGAKPKRANNLNPFDLLLNNDSYSESDVKEDDDLGTESSRSRVELQRKDTKKKKKKKTKTRRKGDNVANFLSSEDNQEFESDTAASKSKEAMEAETKAKNDRRGSEPGNKVGKSLHAILLSLMSIEYKNLNPENEMKKIFGSRIVQAESRQRQQQHHRSGGGGGRQRASLRSAHSVLIPKANWPNPGKSGGLSMRFIDSDASGNQYFAFEHSLQYQSVQMTFYEAVDSMNPDFIVRLLNQHPFHIDSMLQLSDICKMGEDVQMAMELIERTLFAMESAFHPMFNLAVGTCRLDYRRQENRAFFIALFRHLNFIGARACYRSALEFCKLILSLDPDSDPLGMLLQIDFYAIRAHQYQWFVSFYEQLDPTRNLSQLPNWSYSVAVAYYFKAKESDGIFDKADEALQRALIMFPGVLQPLLDKCSIEADKMAGHKFFLEAQLGQTGGLELLVRLYVGRSFHIWKQPELLPWLERNTSEVIRRVESQDSFVKSCADKRASRYQGAPRNVYRHVIMSDIKDATTSLPKELVTSPIMNYDPLPPADTIEKYVRTSRPTQVDDPSAFRVFFRSLLPNFNPTDPLPEQQPGGAEGRGADLRSSVNSLYEAMQDLLGNLHLPEVPHDGADSEDSDDEQGNWQ